MAVLTTTERTQISTYIMRWWSNVRESAAFTKAELAAAVTAADSWADNNASSYNTALPAAFRNSATTLQKSLLLCYVVLRRAKRDGSTIPIPGE